MARQKMDVPPGLGKAKAVAQAELRRRQQQSARDKQNKKQPIVQQVISTSKSKAPKVKQVGNVFEVTHSECVAVINSSTSDYTIQYSGYINPGINSMFPWLSAIGTRYEKFRFKRYQVKYRSQSASTTSGYISIYIDHDSSDPAAVTEQQASNNENAVEIQPWNNGQTDPVSFPQKYILLNQNPSGTDIHTYSPASMYVASGGNPSAGTRLGTIWVSYTVQFSKAQLEIPLAQYAHLNAIVTGAVPFSTINFNNGYQPIVVQSDQRTFTLNGIGEYLINVLWNTTSQIASGNGLANLLQTDPYGNTSTPVYSFRNIITSTNCQQMYKVTLKGLTQLLFSGLTTALSGLDMRITNDRSVYDVIQV